MNHADVRAIVMALQDISSEDLVSEFSSIISSKSTGKVLRISNYVV